MIWAAVSAFISVASAIARAKARNEQIDAQNRQAELDARNSRKAGVLDLSILQSQIQQLQTATDSKMYDREKQGARDRAKILVSAGEANISGNSLMRSVASNMADESRDKGIYKTNLENQIDQGALEAYKIKTSAQQDPDYSTRPRSNPFLRGLEVGIPAGVNVYNQYKEENPGGE
jgi:hypothetical protein